MGFYKNKLEKILADRLKEDNKFKILIIDDEERNIYKDLFSEKFINKLNNFTETDGIDYKVTFIKKELIYDNEKKVINFIKNNEDKLSLVIYGLYEVSNKIYEEENFLLKELNSLTFKTMIILAESENFKLEELFYHHKYCEKELGIKTFSIVNDLNIKNRLINQYEDITNFIEKNIKEEYRSSFSMLQKINKDLRYKYFYGEIFNFYNNLFLDEENENLYDFTVKGLVDFIEEARSKFLEFYEIELKKVNIEILDEMENKLIDGITEKIFLAESQTVEKEIAEVENSENLLKEFLSTEIAFQNNDIITDPIGNTAVMDFDLNYISEEIEKTEVMTYSREEIERELLGKKPNSNKRITIINMKENRAFKEVTLSDDYGINKEFLEVKENATTLLEEIEEVDDKFKQVIWDQDEMAISQLDDFDLVEEGVSKKFKKINMNN
ncbi:MAG: hypothetical protein ACRDD2_07600 [Sarcina sp.]